MNKIFGQALEALLVARIWSEKELRNSKKDPSEMRVATVCIPAGRNLSSAFEKLSKIAIVIIYKSHGLKAAILEIIRIIPHITRHTHNSPQYCLFTRKCLTYFLFRDLYHRFLNLVDSTLPSLVAGLYFFCSDHYLAEDTSVLN